MSDRDSMGDLEKGKQLADRYTLKHRLGSGRHTATWLASDRLTKALVALKIALDPGYSGALRKEWQTSIRLMHAHIVRVFEFHDDPDVAFYSLQWVDGPDIGVLSGAPLEHILPPIGLIADALRYAHGKNVVHRDIKASNILLDHNGAPYLIDFGVASVDADDIGGGSLIAASPQRLDGQPPAPSDDLFGLGGLIHELVGGRPISAVSCRRRSRRPTVRRRLPGSAPWFCACSPRTRAYVPTQIPSWPSSKRPASRLRRRQSARSTASRQSALSRSATRFGRRPGPRRPQRPSPTLRRRRAYGRAHSASCSLS
jgi:serine/threonine protein kinase